MEKFPQKLIFSIGLGGLGLLVFYSIRQRLLLGLNFHHLPITSWSPGLFQYESWLFYLGRLPELSPVYLFSLLSLFIYRERGNSRQMMPSLAALILLLFYALWQNYQCRYILACVPFLILAGMDCFLFLLRKINDLKVFVVKAFLRLTVLTFFAYALLKTFYVNYAISYPNNLCYF